ncbi:MAG: hypothetical protein OXC44_02715 [Proteobacteria bacterium]|nr:hypothetical protein [Pseudomonadota bacterium]
METVRREHIFSGSMEKVFCGISDYAAYPRFIQGVTAVAEVDKIDPKATKALKFELHVIKKFHYVLDMYEEEFSQISWELRSSNFLSHNSGSWNLSEHSPHFTKVVYELNIGFKIIIPSVIIKKLTSSSVPLMFKGFQKLIDSQNVD